MKLLIEKNCEISTLAVYHLVKVNYYSNFCEQIIFVDIWNNAHLQNPTSYGPENNGWVLENDQYHFKWFEGDQLPNYVSDSLKTSSENDDGEDTDDDQSTERSSSDEDDEDIDENDENN
ncbi:protein PFC0760c-like [Zerene cesonia]|uniref:protein PFC0760c-like n=1 Tax=Zerene cesonia TaxID=33412 RepID=UPI0018E5338F|nr:protein PFC0760c-like [Zerene cesonia]